MDHYIVNGGVICFDDVPVEHHLTLPVTGAQSGLEVADDLTCSHKPNHLGVALFSCTCTTAGDRYLF